MELQLESIREQQRESWNRFSPGWKKWDNLFMNFLKPVGEEIIRQLNPENDDYVLDTAAGTGEPGLSIAMLVRNGKVVITDLAEEMVAIAKENAVKKGIRNIETLACDVTELPFADNTFDAVSCRFGFMFFPDMLLAAKEMTRVLKPGGRMAASVWDTAEKNFWVTATTRAIAKYIDTPDPLPGSPGIFRCAKEGLMAGIFREAGLKNITVTEVTGKLDCQTADTYWNVMTEVAAPVVAALEGADEALREQVKMEVFRAVHHRYPGQPAVFEGNSLVICGEK